MPQQSSGTRRPTSSPSHPQRSSSATTYPTATLPMPQTSVHYPVHQVPSSHTQHPTSSPTWPNRVVPPHQGLAPYPDVLPRWSSGWPPAGNVSPAYGALGLAESSGAALDRSMQRTGRDTTSAQSSTESLVSNNEYQSYPTLTHSVTDAMASHRGEEHERRERRKEQNRIAQQELRKRRYEHTVALEHQVADLSSKLESQVRHSNMVEDMLRKVQHENANLRQTLGPAVQQASSTSNQHGMDDPSNQLPLSGWTSSAFAYAGSSQPGSSTFSKNAPILPSPPATANNLLLTGIDPNQSVRRRSSITNRTTTVDFVDGAASYPVPQTRPLSNLPRRVSTASSASSRPQDLTSASSQYNAQQFHQMEYAFQGSDYEAGFGQQAGESWAMEMTPTQPHRFEQTQQTQEGTTQHQQHQQQQQSGRRTPHGDAA